MQRKELLKLIEEGEGLKTEFKQRFSTHEKIAKEIIAFANTRGGFIIFGVDDDKSIYGVESEKGEAELIKETAENYCEPAVKYNIEYFEIENKEVVVVEVKESSKKPHRIQDYRDKLSLKSAKIYIRVNDKSVLASKEIIKLMQTRTNEQKLKNYSVGKNEKLVFEFLNNSDFITVHKLSELANISSRRASRTLINLVRANLLFVHTKDNGENYFTMI
jgi:predicted HTH transcriptional regulator